MSASDLLPLSSLLLLAEAPMRTICVQDLPQSHYQAALVVEGQELLRGNRSRVVFMANVLADKLKDARGPLALVIAHERTAPRARRQVFWQCEHAGALRFVVCFGGAQLRGLEIAGAAVDLARYEWIRLEAGTHVQLQLDNPQNIVAEAIIVVIVEHALPPSREDRRPRWLEELSDASHLGGPTRVKGDTEAPAADRRPW